MRRFGASKFTLDLQLLCVLCRRRWVLVFHGVIVWAGSLLLELDCEVASVLVLLRGEGLEMISGLERLARRQIDLPNTRCLLN